MSVAVRSIGRIRIKPRLRRIRRTRRVSEENFLRDVTDYDLYLALTVLDGI